MAFRIFIALVILGNLFFAYNIFQLSLARALLEKVAPGYVTGPENADLTVVEFLDYTDPASRVIDPIIREAMKEDGHVRFAARPVPMTEAGVLATLFAYAAGAQGKFIEANDLLLGDTSEWNDAHRTELAKTLGLDEQKLHTDMSSDDIGNMLSQNLWLRRHFYGRTLPQFVIGGWVTYSPEAGSTPTVDDFLKMFAQARSLK